VVGSDFEMAIEAYHRSVDGFVGGDPEAQKPLWSHGDDVVLANPLGPPVRGWNAVERAMDEAASLVREGEPNRYQRISEYTTTDLGYIVEIQRGRAKFAGSDVAATVALRVTTIWRREAGEWRITLRHADAITSPRPVQSVLEQ
jgi:ketosteroid isomerase-like protein